MATPFTVNTMTLTGRSTAGGIDLQGVYTDHSGAVERNADAFEVPGGRAGPREPLVVFMVHRTREGGVVRTGRVLKKNGKPKRYSPNVFENQATFVVRMPSGTHTNVKLFRNGQVQMTGARTEDEGLRAARAVVSLTRGRCKAAPGAPPPDVDGGMNVCLMNCDFRLAGGPVDRQRFYHVVSDAYGVQCSFQPSIYPAVKCFFMWRPLTDSGDNACLPYPAAGAPGPDRGVAPDPRPTAPGCDGVCPLRGSSGACCDGRGCCKRVTLLVFHSGAAIVTGAATLHQIDACHRWVDRVCRERGADFFL